MSDWRDKTKPSSKSVSDRRTLTRVLRVNNNILKLKIKWQVGVRRRVMEYCNTNYRGNDMEKIYLIVTIINGYNI